MKKNRLKILTGTAAAILILIVLYGIHLYNYLLFHTLSELFTIVIACGMFMVVWNSRRIIQHQYLLVIGIAYLFIGILDLAHAFSYKGMGILHGYSSNVPTQLWIAARYLESLTLLIAPLMVRRQARPSFYFLAYTLITLGLFCSIFYWQNFPDCFLETAGGLTRFKILSEYLICLLLIGAGAVMYRYRHQFDLNVFRWILASIIITILAELSFTIYIDVYSVANLMGHYFKLISFYCIYKAVIETGLSSPYKLLFRDLKQSKDRYRSLFANMINGFANHQMLFDQNGTPTDYIYLETNNAFENLTGLHNVVGQRVTQLIPGIQNEPADWIGVFGKVAQTGEPIQYENYSERLKKWYSVNAYSPSKGQFAVIFEDITQRKNQLDTLHMNAAWFKLLSESSTRLLSVENPYTILNELGLSVMGKLNCQIYFNYLADENNDIMTLHSFSGITQDNIKKFKDIKINPVVLTAAKKNQQLALEDIFSASDSYTPPTELIDTHSFWCWPLSVQDRFIGILFFGRKTGSQFLSEEVAVMKTFSLNMAQALYLYQVRQTLKKDNIELEHKVKERTAVLSQTVVSLESEIILRKQTEDRLNSANKRLTSRADQLRSLAGKLTMTEQIERKRLASVLHDGLQQHMVTVKFQLSGIGRQLHDPDLKDKLIIVESMMGECIQMSRSLSSDLSPPVLHTKGILGGLKWIKQWMKDKHDFEVALVVEENIKLPEDVTVLIFESLRELLLNTVKHAGVSKAEISLTPLNEHVIQICLQDKGVGFDVQPEKMREGFGSGLGLFSIQERIGLIGGAFDIESEPGKGSCFTLIIPNS